jgi:hypothetical protein
MVTFIIVVMIGALLITVFEMIRLKILSGIVRKAIDETFEKRMAGDYSCQYPNIDATYDGLKWYKPWERPSTLLVYDKEV